MTPWTRADGTWLVISGVFTSVENVPATNIAARNPNTGQWEALGSGVLGQPYALRVFNNDVIVAGALSSAGGQSVSNIARWDGTSWSSLGTGVNGVYIRCLHVHNNELYAGGPFTVAGGVTSHGVARWNGSAWAAVGPNITLLDVASMASWNGELVVGGPFTTSGGAPSRGAMRWNGSSWLPMSTGLVGAVMDLQPFNGGLVAAVNVSSNGSAFLSTWNGSSWSSTSSFAGTTFEDLDVYLSSLMVAGESPSGGLFRWSGVSLDPLGTGIPSTVMAMTIWQNELVAGGTFTEAAGRRSNRLARWNGYDWGPFGWGTAAAVYTMAPFRGRMVAGGDFHQSTANGSAVHRLVTWNGADMVALGNGADGLVRALKSFKYSGPVGSDELVAGGAFLHMDGVAVNRIARRTEGFVVFPPPAWEPMGAGFNNMVLAIERHSDRTYAGGTFTASSATTVNRIARWNETTDLWEAMGTGMNGTVFALRSYGGFLYAGGSFTTAGGVSTGGLARWNGTSWSAVGGAFTGTVYALEVHDNKLVIGGIFAGFGGSPNLAQYDGVSYSTLGIGGAATAVNTLCSNGSRLYAAGPFTTIGGVAADYVAYWDGSGWHEPHFALNASVYTLAKLNNEVHAGGLLTALGWSGAPSPRWARFSETGVPWFQQNPSSRSVEAGTSTSFTALPVGGFEPLTLQWHHDDVPISDGPTGFGSTVSGATTTTLSISNIVFADQGLYKLVVTNTCGEVSSFAATLTLTGVTAAEGPRGMTTLFESAGPNPSSGASQLSFSLAHEAQVRFQVHDVRGRLVRRIDMGQMPAGRHQSMWDARDNGGQRVASGHYYVGFVVDGGVRQTKSLTVLQ
jgi:hypothetical protein